MDVGAPGTLGSIVTLHNQRRMHPEIARLILPLYPHLENDISVSSYPPVRGMRQRVWFYDHEHQESGGASEDDRTSKSNAFEADMVVALVRHLVKQDYSPTQIAVLATYSGQLRGIRDRLDSNQIAVMITEQTMTDEFGTASVEQPDQSNVNQVATQTALRECVRLATVDSFQGEEAEIVVISTVRNNACGQTGFLKTDNRVNVMLSRAKHGMYIFGSAKTVLLKDHGSLLGKAVVTLQEQDSFGSGYIQIQCDRHPAKELLVHAPEDFDKLSPDGGCQQACSSRLNCGHTCPRSCHPNEPDGRHRSVPCVQPCPKVCPDCNQQCQGICGTACRCPTPIILPLPCGHTATVACRDRNESTENFRCGELVKRPTALQCYHAEVLISCHVARRFQQAFDRWKSGEKSAEITKSLACCAETCDRRRQDCGHYCAQTCGGCFLAGLSTESAEQQHQGRCQDLCKKVLPCDHRCLSRCHASKDCPPCPLKCSASCAHSACARDCRDLCELCVESCTWGCEHIEPADYHVPYPARDHHAINSAKKS